MGSDLTILLVLWVSLGALIGGVVTPIIVANKKFSDWTAMLLGVGAGAVGSVVLLAPLWAMLSRTEDLNDGALAWQRDEITLDALMAGAGTTASIPQLSVMDVLRDNFWPAPRADQAHSHRMSYVGVFVALAVITAVEVALTYVSVPFDIVFPLVVLSIAKVVLVMMFFMHLRFDSKTYTALFVLALPFAAMVLTVLALSR